MTRTKNYKTAVISRHKRSANLQKGSWKRLKEKECQRQRIKMLVTVFSLASKIQTVYTLCLLYKLPVPHLWQSSYYWHEIYSNILKWYNVSSVFFCTCLTFCARFRFPFSSSLFILGFFVCMVRCVYMVHVIKIQQIKVTPSIHPSIQHERESAKGSDGEENSNSDTQWNTE